MFTLRHRATLTWLCRRDITLTGASATVLATMGLFGALFAGFYLLASLIAD